MAQQKLDTGTGEHFLGSDPDDISRFQDMIRLFYRSNRRPMPWRDEITPYGVVVSEIMLQQTQVSRVLEKYSQFIGRFPDFQALQAASLADILKEWQGLGYNRRAQYLKQIAEQVITCFDGQVPDDPDLLNALPGIGSATAGSIIVFTYNKPLVFIETNIRRIFIHHFFTDSDSVNDKEILPLISITLDQDNPRDWYYALMDYGTWLSRRVKNPNRKSSHYTRQSPFLGSDRQIRGKILRFILQKGKLPLPDLVTLAGDDNERVTKILHQMVSERLLSFDEGLVFDLIRQSVVNNIL